MMPSSRAGVDQRPGKRYYRDPNVATYTRLLTRTLATAWAVAGFSALLIWSIVRLGQIAVQALQMPLQPWHWGLLVANVIFMAWSEGYRGFQLGYAPRFASRLARLRAQGSRIECLLAPLYVMGFFNAERKRLLITYILTAAIIGLIVLFHQIAQPWRGLLDAGVVVGLSWGLLACWWHSYHALRAPLADVAPTNHSATPLQRD